MTNLFDYDTVQKRSNFQSEVATLEHWKTKQLLMVS